MRKFKVGIIGCGNISSIYFTNIQHFHMLDITACADLDMNRARERAEQYGVPKACGVDELLADPDIDIVLNLTIPQAHAEIHLRALEAGKHTYGEKPLALDLEGGKRILSLAKKKGLSVGCAPDTFLGGSIQTCRKLIDDKWIGEPIGATAFMMSEGPESWHPNPGFLYEKGAGPMFDMGPYYLTTLIHLLGPIRRVAGSTRITFPERMITNDYNYGDTLQVQTPTHSAGILDFHNGAVCTMITSFDVLGSKLPHIEIYGTHGTLIVPDPNDFGGPILVKRHDWPDFKEIPMVYGFTGNHRGIGLMDMAHGIANGQLHRANGDLAYHVLEVMHGFELSSNAEQYYNVGSSCAQPESLPMDGYRFSTRTKIS
ncbi:oxidoreductase [Paenibacillus baekrokdamisoli]|uniref:Oxidoreductase n=1 Tax=Paenibacillus baekrokdamisoli TaxID=1712516 RepID=A0A3G9IN98_9BACL|nr:Gfo/Idh/MocA family oxidoreductase [Paenibacillus baekrokdamisoli]MBB3072046.1 putative dehydrogenase [Paenibacillus baekrokdamisoli]BBH20347.1 oxidoreductase [Paenibacillus baekrokdamisoli]